ncbi:MAG: UDP-N-acetylmuramoyl-L-alanine--D-glutamate ligase [Deltaproteobacteria bacterium]|nr:MAG: UDP-N-acetylmuramoyl-L-alanine--D-glutamate ligase [Deltaproteobacteria bacterium]TMB40529.1 MAG: UDP-N-acetylmuramoyl-L-alanine--D-glutamate ligase [Deltaproteobacteria bacterium]
MKLSRRNALVVGLGKSGDAAAHLLRSRGAQVVGADDKDLPFEGELRRVVPESLRGIDLVVVSPGVPLALPIFAEARSRGVEVIGEVELASRFIEEPIFGVTGTNGKSTTTALCGHLLATAGLQVFTGGNLGDALSNRVLWKGTLDATVCELSSYQLESIVSLRCAAATVLNITPDHLDRYPSLDEYAKAKERIFENQGPGDTAVINEADPRVRAMRTNRGVRRQLFDAHNPLRIEGTELPLRAPTLRGAHNRENAYAACLLARHLGVALDALQKGLDSYPGLPHRLEPVRVLEGVEWINDSKATNVDSVEKSLTAFPGNVHIIMGGRGKGAPYAPLRELMRGRVKTIFTIGEDAPAIASELSGVAEIEPCGALATAVFRARKRARGGDVVLLSPACASYDQFRNFEDRGDQFKALVRGLS